MKNVSLITSLFFLLSVTLLFNSCAVISGPLNYTKEKGAIPKEFGNNSKNILIFLLSEDDRAYNRKIKRFGKSIYKGEHVFLTKDQLSAGAFDRNIYRYIFRLVGYDIHSAVNSNYNDLAFVNFGMYDRKKGNVFSTKVKSQAMNSLIKAYLKNLEKERINTLKKKNHF